MGQPFERLHSGNCNGWDTVDVLRVCVCVHVLVVVVVIQLLSGAHRLKGLPFVIWNLIGSCCSISTLQVCAEAMVCLECVLDGAASV